MGALLVDEASRINALLYQESRLVILLWKGGDVVRLTLDALVAAAVMLVAQVLGVIVDVGCHASEKQLCCD